MDLGLLILRIVGGLVLIAHGLPKWPNREKVAQNWAEGGMPFPRLAVLLAYFAEVPVGLLYIAGLFTGWDSLIMLVFMLVATWWSIRVNQERFVSHGSKGYDLNVSLLALFLVTALAGGGAYSLDALLKLSSYWPFAFEGSLNWQLLGMLVIGYPAKESAFTRCPRAEVVPAENFDGYQMRILINGNEPT
ncbi:MAG: DoxX family protein [Dehalococcoidia bacterium]